MLFRVGLCALVLLLGPGQPDRAALATQTSVVPAVPVETSDGEGADVGDPGDQQAVPATKVIDTITMRNGDVFEGRLDLKQIRLLTPYGLVELKREYMQKIDFVGENRNVDTILALDGGRYSGQLITDRFNVEVGGNHLPLRKEQISGIALGPTPSAHASERADTLITMRNTDTFHAEVLTPTFSIRTAYGVLDFPSDTIESIELEGDERIIGKITLKQDEGSFQGVLENEEILLVTSFGHQLDIYRDKFATLAFDSPMPHATAGLSGTVSFGGRHVAPLSAAAAQSASGPVTDPYFLLLRRSSGDGTVSLSSRISINGGLVVETAGDRTVRVEEHLQQGLNFIEIAHQPIAGISGSNYLTMKLGPADADSFIPELVISAPPGWVWESGAWRALSEGKPSRIPYYVDDSPAVKPGDVALFVKPKSASGSVPLVSEVYVNDALVAVVNGYRDALNISAVASPGQKEVKFVTRAIEGLRATNWIQFEIGRISRISNGRYRYASLLEMENREGWVFENHRPKPRSGKDAVVITVPVTF